MTDTQIPAGWYADPSGDTTKLRYWDGANWTEQTSNATASGGQAPQPMATPVAPVAPVAPTNPYPQPTTTPPPASPYPQPIYQQAAPGAPVNDQSGAAVASLICGIAGILGGGFLLVIFGYVLGVVAIVMGSRGRTSSKKGLATAGIVLGIIALLVALAGSIMNVLLTI
jgi:hypothetical protein